MFIFKSSVLRFGSVILVGAFCLSASAQTAAQKPRRDRNAKTVESASAELSEKQKEKAEKEQLAKDLLTRAYGLSKNLSESDRAFLLSRLAMASAKSMPDKSKAWGDEVFQLTTDLPAGGQRSQSEMQALTAMGDADPDHALQMLGKMDPPEVGSDGTPVPDIRSAAAMMLFQKYWQKRGTDGLDALQASAREMGEAGNYPYMAIGGIIRQVGRKDNDKAQAMTNEALSYFSRRARTDMAAQQMGMFLRMNRDLIPKPIMKDILEQLVSDALETKSSKTPMMGVFSSSRGTATMNGASNLLLFQLLPLIRDIDPEWAKRVEQQSAELRTTANLTDNSASSNNRVGFAIGGGPNAGPPANFMEEMKSHEVDELVKDDPKRALQVADEIGDPVIRAATDARLAGELNKSDPERAAQLLKTAREAMAAAKEPADKLRILVGLAQAQSAMKDKDGFAQTLDQAYTLGEDLYRRAVDKIPDAAIMSRPGLDSMNRLTSVGMRLDSTLTVAHIETIRMPLLQAMLLVSAAQGLDPDSRSQDGPFRFQMRS